MSSFVINYGINRDFSRLKTKHNTSFYSDLTGKMLIKFPTRQIFDIKFVKL
jgi:hypothetical protein